MTNGDRIFKFLQKCNRNHYVPDLHSFQAKINGGTVYVDCRGFEVYIETHNEENVVYYENAEVYFDAEHYGWWVRHSDDEVFSLWAYDDCDITVIGNMQDSPELIKWEKDNG